MSEKMDWILEKEDSGIIWLKLNRPLKRNAFGMSVINELDKFLDEVKNDEDARVLIITSTVDKFFSAGADIGMFLNIYKGDPYKGGQEISIEAQRVFNKIELLSIPVIAAIKGLNLTAGLEMSMCCDMIIAAENAQFGQIETKFGITPGGGGTQRLVRLVGPLKAREMIYSASIVDAKEALKIGLVNKIYPLEGFDDKLREFCAPILKNSKYAIGLSKILINKAIYYNEEGFITENDSFGKVFASGEPKERLSKFLLKRN